MEHKPGKDYIGVGCGAIVVNDKDEVLLVKRASTSRTEPGTWSRPGGMVEFGETVEQAVEREIEEETGIKVRAVRLLEMTQNIVDGKHWIALGFLARHVSGEPENKEPTKHDDIGWFPLAQLPDNLNNYTRNAIGAYLMENRKKNQ